MWGYGNNHVGDYRLKGSFTPAQNTEKESNNSFGTAMVLNSTTQNKVTGFLSLTDSLDFYKIKVPSNRKLRVIYTSKINDTYCEIWNEDQILVNQKDVYYASEENPLTYKYEEVLPAGIYYIKISQYTENANNTGRYMLNVNTISTKPAVKKVSRISISGNKKVTVGQTLSLKAKVAPSNATNKAVQWTSSNKKIATVSSKGIVRVKMPGKVTIQAKAKDGSGVSKKVTVIVLPRKMAAPQIRTTRGKMKLSYVRQSGVTGYQLIYSSRKDFSNYQLITIGKNSKSVTVSGLVSGKTYYARVRSYVKIGTKKYYGSWSGLKSIKIK